MGAQPSVPAPPKDEKALMHKQFMQISNTTTSTNNDLRIK